MNYLALSALKALNLPYWIGHWCLVFLRVIFLRSFLNLLKNIEIVFEIALLTAWLLLAGAVIPKVWTYYGYEGIAHTLLNISSSILWGYLGYLLKCSGIIIRHYSLLAELERDFYIGKFSSPYGRRMSFGKPEASHPVTL